MKLLVTLLALTASFNLMALPMKHSRYEPLPAEPAAPAVALPGITYPRMVNAESSMQRYDRDTLTTLPATAEGDVIMRGWRGERVTAQVLLESPTGFQEVLIHPCMLMLNQGANETYFYDSASPLRFKAYPLQIDIVRYTLADGRLVADILDGTDQTTFDGVVRPLYLTFDIPYHAIGTITGMLKVNVNGKTLTKLIRIEVVNDKVLPPPSDWQFHLDFWQHPDAVARWHDVRMWSEEHFTLLKPQMKRLADMGQKTITATLVDEAWNAQTYDRFRSMIHVTKHKDGSWSYNYEDFDRWVTFMRETIGLENATINCYTMIPWSLTFAYYDEESGTIARPRLEPGTEAYEAFWGPFLTKFVEHLRDKGWESITRIAMDERPDHLLIPALKIVEKYAPTLKIVAACDRPSEINESFQDVSYAYHICEQLVPVAKQRREAGKTTTFYVCVYPARPNTFMASSLAESTWLPVMSANYGLDGLLRWAYQSWVEDPLVSQDYTSWPSGDTSLIYPGNRSSLRLEGLRNGIEIVEKIRVLQEQGTPAQKKAIKEAIKTFTVARGAEPNVHENDILAIEKILNAIR